MSVMEDMIGFDDGVQRCAACDRGLPGDRAFAHIKHGDRMLPLCCPLCLETFQKNPAPYIARPGSTGGDARRPSKANPTQPMKRAATSQSDAAAPPVSAGRDPSLKLDLTMTDESCCPLRCNETHFVRTPDESKALNDVRGPAILISASDMATGGRIVHHLAQRLPDKRNTVLLVGYQAEGTRGRALLGGAEKLKIHGQFVPVRAEMVSISGLSAHGDQGDLMRWLSSFPRPPRAVFLVHGEADGFRGLQQRIRAQLGWPAHVPEPFERVGLGD